MEDADRTSMAGVRSLVVGRQLDMFDQDYVREGWAGVDYLSPI